MPMSVQELQSEDEFPEVVRCEWISHQDPYNAVFGLLCPVFGTHETAREEAIQESTIRQYEAHKNDPTSHWIKVVDPGNGDKIMGAAVWNIHEADPYSEPPEHPMTCFWWPEGPMREMADQVMSQMLVSRKRIMSKPHVSCWVDPQYRRQGLGTLLLQWGLEKADRLGLDTFLESTECGRSLYTKHDFRLLHEFTWEPTAPVASEELARLQRDLTFHGYLMWRPAAGDVMVADK